MSFPILPAVYFIACHGGPADHFATYVHAFTQQGNEVKVYAAGPAFKKFQEREIEAVEVDLENLEAAKEDKLAEKIAKICSVASVVITDVGHPFAIKIQKALATYAEKIPRLAYYDNPETWVPGGYSATAAEVMENAEGILFANANLATTKIYSENGKEVNFDNKQRNGIGYYPFAQAHNIAKRRTLEHDNTRSEFLTKHQIEDKGQKIVIYFGGNNDEYFLEAFPAFLSCLAEASDSNHLKNVVIVIQQHPGAQKANKEGEQVSAWWKQYSEKQNLPKVIVSDFSSNDALLLLDAACYYQTSMGALFVLAGIPTFQIGHKIYEDILVRNQIVPTVTDATQLVQVMDDLKDEIKKPQKELILEKLGIKKNWFEMLQRAIEEAILSKK